MNLFRVNLVSDGRINQDWIKPFSDITAEITKSTDKKAANYSLQNIDLPGHLTFDLLVNEEKRIVSFCGIYNGGRYPKGVYRLINRVYVAPEYRVSHGRYSFLPSRFLFPFQMNEFSSKIKFAFISREHPKSQNYLKKWISRFAPEPGWGVSKEMICVVPGGTSQSCYQFIAYKQYQPVTWNPEVISVAKWRKLKNGQ